MAGVRRVEQCSAVPGRAGRAVLGGGASHGVGLRHGGSPSLQELLLSVQHRGQQRGVQEQGRGHSHPPWSGGAVPASGEKRLRLG